jgi:hypothetical protein
MVEFISDLLVIFRFSGRFQAEAKEETSCQEYSDFLHLPNRTVLSLYRCFGRQFLEGIPSASYLGRGLALLLVRRCGGSTGAWLTYLELRRSPARQRWHAGATLLEAPQTSEVRLDSWPDPAYLAPSQLLKTG